MSDDEDPAHGIVRRLLEQVDTRKGDIFWNPCCTYCYDDVWHRDRYANGQHGAVGDEIWTGVKVPRCKCVCHDARQLLGVEDEIFDPRYPQS